MNKKATPKKDRPCFACRTCANYGFGCPRPITTAEFYAWNVETNQNPDCWERERPE